MLGILNRVSNFSVKKIIGRVVLILSLSPAVVLADHKIDSLINVIQKETDINEKLNTYKVLGAIFEVRQEYALSNKYLHEALEISRQKKLEKQVGNFYCAIGHLNNSFNNWDSARFYFDNALKWGLTSGYDSLLSNVYNGLGILEETNGRTVIALDYYLKSINYSEKANLQFNKANTLHNLSLIFSELNQPDSSLQYDYKALRIRKRINDQYGMASSYNNIGAYFLEKDHYDSAYFYFNSALNISRKLNDPDGASLALSNVAIIQKKRGEYGKAEKSYLEAIHLQKLIGLSENLITSYLNLSFLFLETNRLEKALENAYEALNIAQNINSKYDVQDIYQALYEIYLQKKDYKNSVTFLSRYIALRDSLTNEESIRESTRIQMANQFEKERELKKAEEKQKEELYQEEKKRQTIVIISVSLVLLLTIVFSFFIYRNLQTNRQQKKLIEHKQQEILDSIHYAKRIQTTLLAHHDFINQFFPENFILFKPKDIVSGDFYWATRKNDLFYLAVCDSTGHGVPGAFMSLMNINFINEAINEKNILEPGEILDHVRSRLIESISKEGQKDGFDGILICKDIKKGTLTYSAANNSPIHVSNGQLSKLPCDKMPVGLSYKKEKFITREITLKKGDSLYLYTDGYADQFGGPKGKKYMYKRLNEFLLHHSNNSLPEQQKMLSAEFENWLGNLEQIDDVCIIGIKI